MRFFIIAPLLAFANMGINAATVPHDRHSPVPIVHMKEARQVHNADFSSNPSSSNQTPAGSASEPPAQPATQKRQIDLFQSLKSLFNNAEGIMHTQRDDGAIDASGAVGAKPSDTLNDVKNTVSNPSGSSSRSPGNRDNSASVLDRPRAEDAALEERQLPALPVSVPSLPVPRDVASLMETRQDPPAPPAAPAPPSPPGLPVDPAALPIPIPAPPTPPAALREE